jgi:predicted short-subunit dehydrogenase-like oxidoreductase (DUF2520 family)
MGKQIDVAVIGAGNWGSSLIAALRAAGLGPRDVIGRSGWGRVRLDARVIWACVPDAEIAEVVEKIAARARTLRGEHGLRGQIVVHSSGALSADVLEPARRAGAKIASVHPVMSFPTRRVVPLAGVMFGVEAREPAVRRELFTLARRLGGVPFAVKPEGKALYHAAGVMASPLLVSALAAAMEMARLAGLNEKTSEAWVRALAEATVANVFERGPEASFSGPFARGDAETISLHLEALKKHPIHAEVYCALARHAIVTLPVKNRRALLRAIETGAAGARKLK